MTVESRPSAVRGCGVLMVYSCTVLYTYPHSCNIHCRLGASTTGIRHSRSLLVAAAIRPSCVALFFARSQADGASALVVAPVVVAVEAANTDGEPFAAMEPRDTVGFDSAANFSRGRPGKRPNPSRLVEQGLDTHATRPFR